jgi:membrane protein DedA with SNARE-associated domain
MQPIPKMILVIWWGLLGWALWLATGAWLYAPSIDEGEPQADWRRGVVVLAIVSFFLAGWMLLLLKKRTKTQVNSSEINIHD